MFDPRTATASPHHRETWFFLVGSILLAARPTVAALRENHLARLLLPETNPRAHR